MSTIKTLTIAAALLAGATTLAMAQGTGGGMGMGNGTGSAAPAGASSQQPGTRSGSNANDQKINKSPAGETYKKQDGSMGSGNMDSGK